MSPREAQELRTRLERYRSLLQRDRTVEALARLVAQLESELRAADEPAPGGVSRR